MGGDRGASLKRRGRPGAPAAAPPSPPCALGPSASVLAALGPASLRSAALRSAGAALTLALGLPVLVGWAAAAEGGVGVEPALAEPLPAYVTVLSGAEPADGELGRFDAWVAGATTFGIGVSSPPSGPSPRLALTRHLAATHPELVVAVAADEHTIRGLDDWVQGAARLPPAALEGFEGAEVGAREIVALARWARAWNAGGEGHVRLIGLSTADPAPAAERVRRFLATRAPEWEARVDAAYGSLGRPRELTVGGFWFAAASAPPGDLVWRATLAFPTREATVDVVCTFEGASPPLTADAVRVHKRPFRRAAVRVELGEAVPPRDVACGVTAGEGRTLRVSRMRLSAGGRPVPLGGLVEDGDALTRGGGGEPRLVASPALVHRVGARRLWIRGPVSRSDPGAARALLDDMQAAADGWRAAAGAAAVDGVLADARIVAQALALAGQGSSPSSIGYRQRISNLADAQRRAPGATFVVWARTTTIGRVGGPTVRLGANLSARLGEAYRAIAISIAPGALGAGDPGLGRPGVRAAAGSVEEALSPFGWSVMAELRHAAADPDAPPWITRGPRLRAFGTEDSPPAAPVTYWRLEEGALDVAWAVGWGASGAGPGLPAGSRGTEGSPPPG